MAPEFGKVVPESGEMRPKPLTPCYGIALARPEFPHLAVLQPNPAI
ncbi:hypothetical protein [Mesorhizobium sp. M0778]